MYYDPRYDKLAGVLTQRSTAVQPGEKVLIEVIDVPAEVTIALTRAVQKAAGLPVVTVKQNLVLRDLIRAADEKGLKLIGQLEAARMKEMDAYIGIRASDNTADMSDVPQQLYQEHWLKPVHLDIRVPGTKWVITRWPTAAFAQKAAMSTEAFEDFFFKVTTLDYSKMEAACRPLQTLMEQTNCVRIVGPETDLSFSMKDLPVVPCTGTHNIPDGECFSAPVRDSVEGTVRFNAPAPYEGTTFSDVKFRFEAGKVVEATADADNAKLNEILDRDEGARYLGECALGFNPYIKKPIGDILFDEKIAGSFHLALGRAYEEADNGNRSAVHWDHICIQTGEYGGGCIYFDDVLIRKDGEFVVPELEPLNPDNLREE